MSGSGHDDDSEARAEDEMGKLLAALKREADEDERALARLPVGAYAPLSADRRAAIADAILQTAAPEAVPEKLGPSMGSVLSMERRRRTGRLFTLLAGTVAAAAALVLVVRPFSSERSGAMPEYGITARGGIKEMRGADPAPDAPVQAIAPNQRLRPESRLIVVAHPAAPAQGPVAVRVFVLQAARADEVWPQVHIEPSGEVEIRAPVAEVFGHRTGQWNLVVLIGRPAALSQIDPATAPTRSPDPAWRRLTVPLAFEAP